MAHLTPERLQQYLAGELDLAATDEADEHLAGCSECESLLAVIAAGDAALAEALALTPEEAAWVHAQDLRPAVAKAIAPWYSQPQGIILLLALLAAAGWMLHGTLSLLTQALSFRGPVEITLVLLGSLGKLAWAFLNYVSSGGPFATLWPLLLVALFTVVIRRRKSSHA